MMWQPAFANLVGNLVTVPQFVVGFMLASIAFSIIDQSICRDVSAVAIDHGVLKGLTRVGRE